MRPLFTYPAIAFATSVFAETHYFFSGFFAGKTIVGVEFDDTVESLRLAQNITTQVSDGSKWIAIDVGRSSFHYYNTADSCN